MKQAIPPFLTARLKPVDDSDSPSRGRRTSFTLKAMEYAACLLREGFIQWETATRRGFLQGIDARVKILFLVVFVTLVSVKNSLVSEAAIAAFLLGLALVSRVGIVGHYRKVLALTFVFGFALALPSAFNIAASGEIVLEVMRFEKAVVIWGFPIPERVGVTDDGLRNVGMLSLRVMNSLSVSLLVFATTQFVEFVKGLKALRAPDVFVLTLTLAYKYIFVFTTIVYDMHMGRKSRLANVERSWEARGWLAGRIAFLYHKSRQRCEEVFRAMVARGLQDSVRYRRLPPLSLRDRIAAGGCVVVAGFFYWM